MNMVPIRIFSTEWPWIPPLEDFLRACLEAQVPVAGFCFGHQILAQAAGGKVVKSDKGWGLGVQDYDVTREVDWMTPNLSGFKAMAVHQDQVVETPESATVIVSRRSLGSSTKLTGSRSG